MSEVRCASSISMATEWRQAIGEVADKCMQDLGCTPHAAVVFLSADHVPHANQITDALCDLLQVDSVVGCTAESLAGRSTELELSSGISLWTAYLPGVDVDLIRLEFMQTPDGGTVTGWPDDLSVPWPEDSLMLLLADPFTFPADWLLERMQDDRPGLPVLGGMASAAATPGDNRLIFRSQATDCGAVAMVLRNLRMKSIVSQGCRPVRRTTHRYTSGRKHNPRTRRQAGCGSASCRLRRVTHARETTHAIRRASWTRGQRVSGSV